VFDQPPEPEARPAPKVPVFQAPAVVPILIGVLIAIHAVLWLAGTSWQVWALYALAFIPARFGGGEAIPFIPGSQYWSLLTHAFLHADATHLLFNCLWLLIFGTVVARYLRTARFLLLAAISAIGGALLSLALHWGEGSIMIGASGAVSGLMGAAVPIMYGRGMHWGTVMAGDARLARPLSPGELLRNRNALLFTLVWLGITLYSGATGWTGNSYVEDAKIAWEAHLGGFISGLAAFYLLAPRASVRSFVP
jgi:membrane associated rhomboid family serine protease